VGLADIYSRIPIATDAPSREPKAKAKAAALKAVGIDDRLPRSVRGAGLDRLLVRVGLEVQREGSPTGARALVDKRERRLVDQNSASWNRLASWLHRVEALRAAA
jgi:hypothetical protein